MTSPTGNAELDEWLETHSDIPTLCRGLDDGTVVFPEHLVRPLHAWLVVWEILQDLEREGYLKFVPHAEQEGASS